MAPEQLPLILVWSWKGVKMGNFWPKSKAIGFGFWWNLAPKQLPLILVWSWKAVKMGNFRPKSKAIGFGICWNLVGKQLIGIDKPVLNYITRKTSDFAIKLEAVTLTLGGKSIMHTR